VAAGSPLLAVVPLDDVWIDANFKEGQLERMRAGQPVTVHTDLYGHDVTYHGHVVGIAAGSGKRLCPIALAKTRRGTGSRSCSACRCAFSWTQGAQSASAARRTVEHRPGGSA